MKNAQCMLTSKSNYITMTWKKCTCKKEYRNPSHLARHFTSYPSIKRRYHVEQCWLSVVASAPGRHRFWRTERCWPDAVHRCRAGTVTSQSQAPGRCRADVVLLCGSNFIIFINSFTAKLFFRCWQCLQKLLFQKRFKISPQFFFCFVK